ncbi:TAXI family TRAP transporter solute-binding subunit [Methylibium sp.]|uniref:nSTAND1 domain-containing NTPase n=1 Tax=Methylibium sp. TaxID=2067992 RepID=UPI00182D9793|nr:TAXI family TRAP transporter solute-binding subunit [Methylibium sp.]MBA3590435.1 hypothetical protein [Methylibium sp.]
MTISARWPSARTAKNNADDEQAVLLAGTLRSSRLTVLYGGAGVGKTALLTAGVLPLLDRPLVEAAAEAERAVRAVEPLSRAIRIGGAAPAGGLQREVGVFFDGWQAPPWASLQAVVRQALAMPPATAPSPLGMAQTLAAWTQPRGVRLLVILDRFEECLAGAAQRPDLRVFADELVQSVNRPDLHVNFLVALRDDAEPLMARLCRRIPGFDPHRLELAPARADAAGALPVATANPFAESRKPGFRRLGRPHPGEQGLGERSPLHRGEQPAAPESPPSVAPISQNATMPVVAASGTLSARAAAAAPEPAAADESAPDPLFDSPGTVPHADAATAPRLDGRRWLQWIAVPAALAGVLFFIDPSREQDSVRDLEVAGSPTAAPVAEPAPPRAEPLAPTPPAPTPPEDDSRAAPFEPAAPPSPPIAAAPVAPPAVESTRIAAPGRPRLEIATDFGAVTDRRLAGELARAMAPAAGIEVGVLPSVHWATSLAGPGGAARLAIVRYDALQAARNAPEPLALEIVAPLHTDAISFLVADDSPLRFIHEIEGRRINIGPAQSAGGLTVASVYERLFGKPLAPSRTQEQEPQAALQQLLVERSIDVMVVVGAAPAALQATRAGPGPRLLALDRDHPASRRALQAFLPTTTSGP